LKQQKEAYTGDDRNEVLFVVLLQQGVVCPAFGLHPGLDARVALPTVKLYFIPTQVHKIIYT
jgi:hypothetical protein